MGIFSRFKDIVNSNINSMLAKAEDPEKLLKLMIQEMEDTLVELKSSCAGAMASRKKEERSLAAAVEVRDGWQSRAELAMEKGREELAREALLEKRNVEKDVATREENCRDLDTVIERYRSDIAQLEDRLGNARKKHRVLVQRQLAAERHSRSQKTLRKSSVEDVVVKFEQFENRIDRMEAEADLINAHRKPSLEDEFEKLSRDEGLEKELEALREKKGKAKA